ARTANSLPSPLSIRRLHMRMWNRLWKRAGQNTASRQPLRACRPALEMLETRDLLASAFLQTNLLSDIPGVARLTDSNLVNPWGLTFAPTGPFWISDNGTGLAAVYDGAGQSVPPNAPLVVTIPLPPRGSGNAAPTSTVFNGTGDFIVTAGSKSGASTFLF